MHVPLRPWQHYNQKQHRSDQEERDKKRDNFLRFAYVHPSGDDCCEEHAALADRAHGDHPGGAQPVQSADDEERSVLPAGVSTITGILRPLARC